MQGGIGSVILGFVIWRLTGNIWIGAIASVVLWPLFNPIIAAIFQLPVMLVRGILSLFEPQPVFSVLKEIDASKYITAGNGKGVRLLLVSKGKPLPVTEEEKRLYESTTNKIISDLYAKNEVFRFKLDQIIADGLPVRVCHTTYKVVMSKAFSEWRKILEAESFELGNDDKDTFTVEKKLPEADANAELNVVITFDKALPSLEKPKEEQKAGQEKPDSAWQREIACSYELQFDTHTLRLQTA